MSRGIHHFVYFIALLSTSLKKYIFIHPYHPNVNLWGWPNLNALQLMGINVWDFYCNSISGFGFYVRRVIQRHLVDSEQILKVEKTFIFGLKTY